MDRPVFLSDTSLRLSLNFNPGEALGELDIDWVRATS